MRFPHPARRFLAPFPFYFAQSRVRRARPSPCGVAVSVKKRGESAGTCRRNPGKIPQNPRPTLHPRLTTRLHNAYLRQLAKGFLVEKNSGVAGLKYPIYGASEIERNHTRCYGFGITGLPADRAKPKQSFTRQLKNLRLSLLPIIIIYSAILVFVLFVVANLDGLFILIVLIFHSYLIHYYIHSFIKALTLCRLILLRCLRAKEVKAWFLRAL